MASGVLWLGTLIVIFRLHALGDRILRRLHERHRSTWTELGELRGIFWKPPSPSGGFYDYRGMKRAFAAIRASTSDALQQDVELQSMTAERRRWTWIGLLNFVVFATWLVAASLGDPR